VRVLYDDPETGATRQLRRAVWPPLDSISRLSPEGDQFQFRFTPGAEFEATLAPVLEPEYAAPPWLLGALLLAGAAALLVLPGRHVARWALARRREAVAAAEVPPLERALRRVEQARDNGDADEQRHALEALAVVLEGNGSGSTGALRELAWSLDPPPAERLTAMVATLREADGAPV
jgi:hypothetical protein